MLHGLGGCSFDWEHVAAAGTGPALAPDAPYHGGRSAEVPLTFEAFARDALRCADQAGFDRFVLAGLSMGAATALTMMAVAPQRALGAVLLAPAWLDQPEPPNLRPLQRIGRLVRRRGLADAWTVLASLPPLSGWSPQDRAAYRARYLGFDPVAVARALVELPGRLPRMPTAATLRGLAGRVEVVAWPGDEVHPLALADRTARVLGVPLVRLDRRPPDRAAEARTLGRIVDRVARSASAGQMEAKRRCV